jgi:rare lipoprotein A (peptidoglycan hydrolase)
MGAYSVPETGEEKVSQGWADAFKSVGTAAIGAYGNKFGNQATSPGGEFNPYAQVRRPL